jgi:hypothetical protein
VTSKLGFGVAAMTTTLSWAAAAGAQPIDNAAQADASFKEAMELRAAGHDAEACPKFAQSKRLSPGVGVTLYLADCYERTGRPASAWQEFRDGEKLARERSDKRADVAAARAAALEPKLNRLTLESPAGEMTAGSEVQLDGKRLPPDWLNVALAVDPGDHIVTVVRPGQASLTQAVHVDAGNRATTVRLGPAAAPAASGSVPTNPAPTESSPGEARASNGSAARWAAGGLMVAGAAGIGIGTWLVTTKVQDVMPNGQLCDPHLRPGAIPEAATAFSAGGVAVLSGIILYYVNRPGRNEVSLSPAFVPGGGGAVLRARF